MKQTENGAGKKRTSWRDIEEVDMTILGNRMDAGGGEGTEEGSNNS